MAGDDEQIANMKGIKTMKRSELDKKIKAHMSQYKKDILGITENGLYKKRSYEHILPKLESNLLPMALWPVIYKEDLRSVISEILFPEKREVKMEYIKPHVYANHLNSSQVMCINFFSPLCNDEKGKEVLLKLICQVTGFRFSPGSQILNCEFEKRTSQKERTSVDFYINLNTGEEIFFEIKYTERRFGLAKSKTTDYTKQWKNTYSDMCKKSLLLQRLEESPFLKYYQIYRNIVLIQNKKQFVCFIYPFVSELLVKDMDEAIKLLPSTNNKRVMQIDWAQLCLAAKELTKDTKFYFHYYLFEQKYILPLL